MVGRSQRDRGRGHALTIRRALLAIATIVYLAALAALTLGPQPEGAGGTLFAFAGWFSDWAVTAWITFDVLEFTANVVLFLPAGALTLLWSGARRWWIAPPLGLALSLAIETTQALALPDRIPDGRDLMANTLGAALGMLTMLCARRVHRERIASARIMES